MSQESAPVGEGQKPSADSIFRRHKDVTFACYGEEGLIVVPKEAWQLVVNPIGARVFELLDGQRSINDIAEQLCTEFDAAKEDVIVDVVDLMAQLQTHHAVEIV